MFQHVYHKKYIYPELNQVNVTVKVIHVNKSIPWFLLNTHNKTNNNNIYALTSNSYFIIVIYMLLLDWTKLEIW